MARIHRWLNLLWGFACNYAEIMQFVWLQIMLLFAHSNNKAVILLFRFLTLLLVFGPKIKIKSSKFKTSQSRFHSKPGSWQHWFPWSHHCLWKKIRRFFNAFMQLHKKILYGSSLAKNTTKYCFINILTCYDLQTPPLLCTLGACWVSDVIWLCSKVWSPQVSCG